MFIRDFTREDIPQAVDIIDKAFADDELYNFLWPRKDKYPDDLRRFFWVRLRMRLVEQGSHGFVMVTEESDRTWTGNEEVIGYSFWVRDGDANWAHKMRADTLFHKIERYLLSWDLWYHKKFVDRAGDYARVQLYAGLEDDVSEPLFPLWHLGGLAVSPNHQRRGIGRELVEHGQKLATKENVPCTLSSSIIGRDLYRKCGFKIIDVQHVVEGPDEVVMAWEPEHLKGKWLEDIGDGKANVIRHKEGPVATPGGATGVASS
ncbi:acyl-CoA N-acyltransferase [Lophiotrema nucula]|uniref:Acyl-CoA N-acyltransferase n=1 Tax=Lophiotrema nucula TaxID=690887 RepID=A0A6A5Z1F3_9PLEO|nr:acyl-CoA N-acyltransferase [Lophiotrema nucula]